MGNGGQILAPDKPPQVSEKEWRKAVVNNPDPQNYMPVALIGAVALQGRVSWQQDRAKELASNAATLHKSHDTIKHRSAHTKQDVEEKARRYAALRKRLLDVMRRVELARCLNQQFQPDEFKAVQRLNALLKEVDSVRGVLISLQDKARTQTAAVARSAQASGIPDRAQLLPVLKEQRQKLETLTNTARRDLRDVSLVQQRVSTSVPALARLR
jgi:chromosome segregation ATPase